MKTRVLLLLLLWAMSSVARAIEPRFPAPLPEGSPPLVSEAGVALIIRYEVGSPEQYTRRYQRPVWPGGASGITVGVGYDLGHQSRDVIAHDWARHPKASRMLEYAGMTGDTARRALPLTQDIVTPYSLAHQVFTDTSLIEYWRRTRRAFPMMDRVTPNAQASLVATVYNRGNAMQGERRREMRVIRDVCLPAGDESCMADQYRSMFRLWRGSSIESGMVARYEATARLALTP